MIKKLIILTMLAISFNSIAQTRAEKEVIQLNVKTIESPPSIEINWPLLSSGNPYMVYRRDTLGTGNWGPPIASVPISGTSYTDNNVKVGENYEYLVQQASSYGYVYSGIKSKAEHPTNGLILLIDSTYAIPLKAEIDRLENDLQMDNWYVEKTYVNRNEKVADIKSKLIRKKNNMAGFAKAIFILGHVPVPYSGNFGGSGAPPPPDGHVVGSGNHTGAWSADAYYGDWDGTWTDATVTNKTGRSSRLYNEPGDGKFDQSKFPSDIEAQVGRVDFYNMPAFTDSDTLLLKKYLDRNHRWRTGQVKTTERALVDNNFSGLNLASTGYHNLSTFFNRDSVSNRDYFTEMKSGPYMWSYGCGAGSYSSCRNVGTTADFAKDSLQSIFTILAGSFFGDWDVKNNLMRASIANSALLCFWGGIPKWYVHSMALGKNVGIGTRASMNNSTNYFNGNFNASYKSVHMALMGDPTLIMRPFLGADKLTATSKENKVTLNWTAAIGQVEGYYVYRVNPYFRYLDLLNTEAIKGRSFVDSLNKKSGTHEYVVRAVRIDTTASGTFMNLSRGTSTSVEYKYNPALEIPIKQWQTSLKIYPNPGKNRFQLELLAQETNALKLLVRNVSGQIVDVQSLNLRSGHNIHQIEHDYIPGIYFVELSDEHNMKSVLRYIVSE